jgi:predicted nucleic acid-binding protein
VVVAFDNSVVCLLLHPDADIPNDPATGKLIERGQDRMAYLVEQLREASARILIPAPVLSEFMTFASPDYLTVIHASAYFEIAPFDERAALEAAIVLKKALKAGLGKKLGLEGNWQKIKVDRQIVAIAKVGGAQTIYTTDPHVIALAADSGIHAVHAADLPLPPSTTPLLDGVPAIDSDSNSAAEPEE